MCWLIFFWKPWYKRFCNIRNVFTVTFDQLNLSLLNKNYSFLKILLFPNFKTVQRWFADLICCIQIEPKPTGEQFERSIETQRQILHHCYTPAKNPWKSSWFCVPKSMSSSTLHSSGLMIECSVEHVLELQSNINTEECCSIT